MRHVLSTHVFVQHRLTVALLDRIAKAGISEIEIFCARQHLDYQNRAQIEELAHWFRDSDLKVHSMHSPMYRDTIWGRSGPHSVISITETEKVRRIAATDEIKRALEIAELIPFRYLIQHIGVGQEEYHDRKMDAAFTSLEELSIFAGHRGVALLVENIPNALSTPERLVAFLNSTHLPIDFVFDTGHAHIMGGVEPAFQMMQARIRSTHVHDNDGEQDSHLFPSKDRPGGIKWKETMHLLRSRQDQYPLLLELREVPDMEHPLNEIRSVFDRLESL
ncbi:MAG TPA: sugar phosphate isomerase/epimerase family protein [Bryobacterales bacterium]|nr:sugar phosphate isomerase/epimerase family protein [Bryobacterales bacterium]